MQNKTKLVPSIRYIFAYRKQLLTLLVLINAMCSANVTNAQSDTTKKEVEKKALLDAPVSYKATDSMRFDLSLQKVYLWGKASVSYQSMNLKAGYIELSLKEGRVYASGLKDSTGKIIDKPAFEDGENKLTASSITYDFKSKRGIIKEVRTQEGDGYIHMEVSKKQANDEIHLLHGKYTTCDLDEPHYYFDLSKAIIIPDDKIVSGPVHLVIADVHTPVALPFGFFPNHKREAQGVILPQFGESAELGFFLLNGGYYLPIGKKCDMQLLGDIYSRGSWGAKNITRYVNRYRNKGIINISYNELKRSEREFPDFNINREFFIRWQHEQDPKARPNSRFTANVNAGTRNNFRNNFNTVATDYLSNTFQSNISWAYNFPGKPMNLNVNLRHNQNTINRIVNITAPEITYNLNRIYPLAGLRKNKTSNKKWYENIGLTYNTNFKNDITIPDSLINIQYPERLTKYMRNGVRHNATLATTFKLKQFATLNPVFNFTERWYFQTLRKEWNNDLQQVQTDTVSGFSRAMEYNFTTSLTSKIYGFYSFKGKKQSVIRHVFTPTLNFSTRPDFSSEIYGYFGSNGVLSSYSPYDIGIFGKPSSGRSGIITLAMINNIEMKKRSVKDTVSGFKKIMLLENFTVNAGYDMFKQQNNWTNIQMSGRTNIYKNVGLVYGGIIDLYVYDNGLLTNELMINRGSGLGRVTQNNMAVTANFKSKQTINNDARKNLSEEQGEEINRNRDAYVDFTIPWTLNIAYNIRQDRRFIGAKDTSIYTQAIVFNGDILLTENWKIAFSSGYDFTAKQFSYTQIDIYRDLHCWEMRFNWIPFGFRKSYMLQINVKSAILQDLKLTRRRSWIDTF